MDTSSTASSDLVQALHNIHDTSRAQSIDRLIRSTARGLTHRGRYPNICDDLTQDCWTKLLKSRNRLIDSSINEPQLRNWIRQVMRNQLVSDFQRSAILGWEELSPSGFVRDTPEPLEVMVEAEHRDRLELASTALNEVTRKILTYRFDHGLAWEVTAALTGLSSADVARGRARRAIAQLRTTLDAEN